jgi:16S rRNA (guanine966-N2)-methyltransferase
VPRPRAHRVRIIGGAFRGRLIRFPPIEGLRPTPDRVRETLFNWLGRDLAGWRSLDLYAGSGALSLEAVSRGAALAVAVDVRRAAVDAIAAAGAALGAHALEPHEADVRAYLNRERREFDVVFCDPPFRDEPWAWLLPACAARLAAGGFLYAEAGRPLAPPPGLAAFRSDRAGQVHYHLFVHPGSRVEATGPAPAPSPAPDSRDPC